jgi:hypothetical protein
LSLVLFPLTCRQVKIDSPSALGLTSAAGAAGDPWSDILLIYVV